LPGAQASNNSGHDLGALQFGLQNGRRTADDVTDIVLRMGRELADVAYTPAGEAVPLRHALRCGSAIYPATPPSLCSDSRVTAVLQGTDWIEPDLQPSIGDPLGALNNTADSGNDRILTRGSRSSPRNTRFRVKAAKIRPASRALATLRNHLWRQAERYAAQSLINRFGRAVALTARPKQ
jgi:hypothetical protein